MTGHRVKLSLSEVHFEEGSRENRFLSFFVIVRFVSPQPFVILAPLRPHHCRLGTTAPLGI